MKVNQSKDGVPRASLRINFRIEKGILTSGALEVAEDKVNLFNSDAKDQLIVALDRLTKKEVIEKVRDRLQAGGYNWASFGHEQTGLSEEGMYDDLLEVAEEVVDGLFPEFSS